MDRTDAPDAWSAFAVGVFEVNGLLVRAGEGITRPLGQSSARWQVLGRAFEPQTVADIARGLGLARQSVQRTADVLAHEGLVRFRAHPADRRTKLVELTAAGRRVLSAIYGRQVEWSDAVLQDLDPDALASVTAGLAEIASVLRRHDDTDRHPQAHAID